MQQKQKKTALRWLLVLLIVPIAIQILTKNLIFEPFLSGLSDRNPAKIELSQEVREEFLTEFSYLKEN